MSLQACDNRGRVYDAQGDRAKAAADCSRAPELDPSSPAPCVTRAFGYVGDSYHAKAIPDCSRAPNLTLKLLRHTPVVDYPMSVSTHTNQQEAIGEGVGIGPLAYGRTACSPQSPGYA